MTNTTATNSTERQAFFTTCDTDTVVAFAVHFANSRQAEKLADALRVLEIRGVEIKP